MASQRFGYREFKERKRVIKYTREDAINKLGGIICRGLAFIGGPSCPTKKAELTLDDIQIAHKKVNGRHKNAECKITKCIRGS